MSRTAHLRAGDADRERTASELGRHYAEGRLTEDELAERVEVAYSARTLGELAEVARDLPAPGAARPPRRRSRRLGPLAVSALVLTCAVVGVGVLEAAAEDPLTVLGVIVLLAVGVALLVVALLPLLIAAAPVVMVVLGARWVARELGVGRSRGLPRVRSDGIAAPR